MNDTTIRAAREAAFYALLDCGLESFARDVQNLCLGGGKIQRDPLLRWITVATAAHAAASKRCQDWAETAQDVDNELEAVRACESLLAAVCAAAEWREAA